MAQMIGWLYEHVHLTLSLMRSVCHSACYFRILSLIDCGSNCVLIALMRMTSHASLRRSHARRYTYTYGYTRTHSSAHSSAAPRSSPPAARVLSYRSVYLGLRSPQHMSGARVSLMCQRRARVPVTPVQVLLGVKYRMTVLPPSSRSHSLVLPIHCSLCQNPALAGHCWHNEQ